jgi:hypothetical protein
LKILPFVLDLRMCQAEATITTVLIGVRRVGRIAAPEGNAEHVDTVVPTATT